MKLVHCPECRKAVVARGIACAECGLNLSGTRRNWLMALIWSLALVLTVQGSIVLFTRFH